MAYCCQQFLACFVLYSSANQRRLVGVAVTRTGYDVKTPREVYLYRRSSHQFAPDTEFVAA